MLYQEIHARTNFARFRFLYIYDMGCKSYEGHLIILGWKCRLDSRSFLVMLDYDWSLHKLTILLGTSVEIGSPLL